MSEQAVTKTHAFKSAYDTLNPKQKEAVDTIEGPVLVLAGPGTGKTQILAVRIGKILLDTDTQAHNLLCLTYTDAATIAMRKRLVQIIGADAHKIHISTFHGFANQVIQENLGIFGDYRQLEPISDLETVDVYKELIDTLPKDHALKRLKSDSNFEAKRMRSLFSMMKKENLSAEIIDQRVAEYIQRKEEDASDKNFFYQRKYKDFAAGDAKPKWAEHQEKLHLLKEAAKEFVNFNAIMDRKERYDYDDMILWVLKAFEEDETLLASYQERYQYFLVDEYQDTNGSQNRILSMLIDFWDRPNVFVVGDDDQAIYKFQGANVQNIGDLKKQYNPVQIVLENNYRSNQDILDYSKALIDHNNERIGEAKTLIASGKNKDKGIVPQIYVFDNIKKEEAYIADALLKLDEENYDLNKVAIIYRNHSHVDSLVNVLEKKGLPLNIKRRINILRLPIIRNIIKVLEYINAEYETPNSKEGELFEIMHYDFFNIDARDIAKIAITIREKDAEDKISWRDVMSDKDALKALDINSVQDIFHFNLLLESWTKDINNVTLQVLFEKLLNEGYILKTILQHPDKTWLLQVITTLFDFIKDETNRNPNLDLKELLLMIRKMNENDIEIGVNKVAHSTKGVNFITAHSAKGLEFEKVYLIRCTKDVWDRNRATRNQYAYPDNVNEDVETNTEDERRLFYVAMTRAEQDLYLTYSNKKETGKDLAKSMFIDEIAEKIGAEIKVVDVAQEILDEYLYTNLLLQSKKVQLVDHDLIDKILMKYKLSVTGLNKYLKCQVSFYFESILRVPSARNKYSGFGTAVHMALQFYYRDINRKESPNVDTLLEYFLLGMKKRSSHFTEKEYEDLLAYGNKILVQYYDENIKDKPLAKNYALEAKIENAEYKGIPIKGVLDKVEVFDHDIKVVDYKTGNFEKPDTKQKMYPPNDRHPLGGDYWRQIVFYKLLLDSDRKYHWDMEAGYIDFVEPKQKTTNFLVKKIQVSPEDIDKVGEQIEDSWTKIQNHEFDQLCDDEKCYWCEFVRNDFVFAAGGSPQDEDEIQEM